ncbi:MAG: 50S ribosomal protein L19e [Candidatus Aenigmarchaeota archaeon]|nr:50S ribosomal protein L19e [Candidatus Aenigmarchaeota archaeon]
MAQLTSQKKIAARVLKCGESRVWFDPARGADIAEAITAADVRRLHMQGAIKELPAKGNSRGRARAVLAQKRKGRRKGIGSRKGKASAGLSRKESWIKTIRALRDQLNTVRASMDHRIYRQVYRKAGSGFFRSRAHMMTYLERNKMLRDSNAKKKA